MQVTQHALQSGDEITAVLAFETFLDLLEVPASWVGAFFPALVKLSVETASNTQLKLNTREQALQVQYCDRHQLSSSSQLAVTLCLAADSTCMCRHSGCVVSCRDVKYLEGLLTDLLLLQYVFMRVHLCVTCSIQCTAKVAILSVFC